MAIVGSVNLDLPSSDPNINEAATFDMQGDVIDASHGGMDYDMYWEYDQGTSTWITIPSTGSELTVAANPILSHNVKGTTLKTVTGVGAGVYQVRIRTIDNNDSVAEDLSSTQTVTVNAVGGARRVFIV